MITIRSHREPSDLDARRLYAYDGPGGMIPVGHLFIHWDTCAGYAGDLRVGKNAPYGTAHALIARGVQILAKQGCPGVLIHTQGENTTRRFYRRLGFVDVHGIPGLKSAAMADLIARVRTRENRTTR